MNITLQKKTYRVVLARRGPQGAPGTGGGSGSGSGYGGTSTTSNTIGTGTKTFATQSGLAYTVGSRVRAINAASDWVEGTVTSYAGTTLVISSDLTSGSGTSSSWSFSIAGVRGATGATGADGAAGATGATGAAGAGYGGTSSTSLSIGTFFPKIFTTQAGLAYVAGMRIRAYSSGSGAYMDGAIASYSGVTLGLYPDVSSGSGTYSDWVFFVVGETGATGATGPAGPAPSGAGLVSVTAGVLDTPTTLRARVAADASNLRSDLGLGTLATQSGTFSGSHSGTSSGTNTGDQNLFSTVAVSGQSNVVADSASDTLTLVAGTNVTITTDASTDTITINASVSGGGGGDVVGPASATDGVPVLFDGTTGKLIKNSTPTGTGNVVRSNSPTLVTPALGTPTILTLTNATGLPTTGIDGVATNTLVGRSTAGTGPAEQIACTAAGRAILDDADATAQRTTLGLGTLATQNGTFSGTSSGTNTGDQTITLSGDATGTGTSAITVTIPAGTITLAKMANMATASILGRNTAGAGAPEVLAASTVRSLLSLVIGTNVQAWDADLDGLAALAANGIVARTGSGTYSPRTLTAPAAGITVSNGDGVSGNPTLALANDLAALEALGNGIPKRTGTDTWTSISVWSECIEFAVGTETAAMTVGQVLTWRARFAFTMTSVRASVTTAPTGSTIIFDVKKNGTTIFSTKPSIDASEKTTVTAATASVLSTTSFADDDEVTIHVDQIGSSTAGAGPKVAFYITRALP